MRWETVVVIVIMLTVTDKCPSSKDLREEVMANLGINTDPTTNHHQSPLSRAALVVEAATHVAEVNMAVSKKNNTSHQLKTTQIEETKVLRTPNTISLKLPERSPGINSNSARNSDLNMTISPNATGTTSKSSLLVTSRATTLLETVSTIEEVSEDVAVVTLKKEASEGATTITRTATTPDQDTTIKTARKKSPNRATVVVGDMAQKEAACECAVDSKTEAVGSVEASEAVGMIKKEAAIKPVADTVATEVTSGEGTSMPIEATGVASNLKEVEQPNEATTNTSQKNRPNVSVAIKREKDSSSRILMQTMKPLTEEQRTMPSIGSAKRSESSLGAGLSSKIS